MFKAELGGDRTSARFSPAWVPRIPGRSVADDFRLSLSRAKWGIEAKCLILESGRPDQPFGAFGVFEATVLGIIVCASHLWIFQCGSWI